MSFEGSIPDADGRPVRLYSVVTPIAPVLQYFEDPQEPIALEPGVKLVVIGAADGDPKFLWLEIDHLGHPWADADVVLSSSQIRYLCEVGDDLHMKARH